MLYGCIMSFLLKGSVDNVIKRMFFFIFLEEIVKCVAENVIFVVDFSQLL